MVRISWTSSRQLKAQQRSQPFSQTRASSQSLTLPDIVWRLFFPPHTLAGREAGKAVGDTGSSNPGICHWEQMSQRPTFWIPATMSPTKRKLHCGCVCLFVFLPPVFKLSMPIFFSVGVNIFFQVFFFPMLIFFAPLYSLILSHSPRLLSVGRYSVPPL